MATETPADQFTEFNLDPALAEMVEGAPPEQLLEGILRLEDPATPPPSFLVVSRFNRICTGRFRAADTWQIRRHPNVISLKAARPLGIHEGDNGFGDFSPASSPMRTYGPSSTGRGCIVAALDFGIDFAHPNFLNRDGTSRLIAFLHQGADYDPARPNRFGYGREYSREEINAALRAPDPYRALGYHPAISDTGLGSHGTHTLDIAAGNGRAPGSNASAARDADLIFVHLSTPRLGVTGDLGDSVRLLEALDFVNKRAAGRPWVANLSVGRTAGSHDGTSLVEQGMHELLRLGPSRAIVQSAGNYRAANLAVEGWLRDGEHRDLEWIVDAADTTANEMDAWYSGKDRFVVAIKPPGASAFTEVKLGGVADLKHGGPTIGRIYHRRNDPNNHDNQIELFLHEGAPPGTWTVRLIGDYVISGRYHAWIERDLARPGAQSRFRASSTSRRYTLGTIATSPLPITVGAYDAAAEGQPPAHFSSSGPTRDERTDKPELLAPGVKVIAARSNPRKAARQQGLLIARSGTSMAAPHVAGTVAAMFEAAGRPVSIDVIRDCLKHSADPIRVDKHTDRCAWGRLNAAKAIRSIRALSNARAEDLANPSVEQLNELPLDEGVAMTYDTGNRILDEAERAAELTIGDRRQSESAFLRRLLRILDGDVSLAELSPAALFKAILHDRPLTNRVRDVLEIVGMPSQRPADALRSGDWVLRAVPGTGDVGHVSVLASDDLRMQPMIAFDGIAAESARPGLYGLVIEAGAFPHGRAQPFARRLLDSRGCVSPHTVILRPRYPEVDRAAWVGHTELEASESQAADASDTFTPPSWLKIEQRSRRGPGEAEVEFSENPPAELESDATEEPDAADEFTSPAWLKIEQRSRRGPGEAESEFSEKPSAEFEFSEDFTFEPTGAQTDFGPQLRKAWHTLIQTAFKLNVDVATQKIAAGLMTTDADAAKHVRFFSPASRSPAIALTEANVPWRALPTKFGSPSTAIYKFLDEPQDQFDRTVAGSRLLRNQDEYCEWQAFPKGPKKIERVVFTSEPPEYYNFLYDPGVPSLQKFARQLLVKLYQERCGDKKIKLADLETTVGGVTQYDRGNKWNNEHCVHLQQPANTLGAQINIAARAAVVRRNAGGTLITDVKTLIACDGFGDPDRQSDPFIGDNVNKLARENRFLTLENPVGLYMSSLDTAGWTTPDGTDAQTFWKVLKGRTDKDPRKSMIVRAQFAVPKSKGYTVSDIKIAGVPIEFGSQVAEHLHMRLGARFGPKDKDPKGATISAPTPVVC